MGFGYLITYFTLNGKGSKIYYDDYHNNYYLYARAISGYFCAVTWFEGIVAIPLGDAISIILMSPIFVVLMGVFIGEKIGCKEISASLMGFIGVLFITKPPFIMSFFGETGGAE